MRAAIIVLMFIIPLRVTSLFAADPPAKDQVSPKFVIYSSEEDAEFGSSLFRVLRGKGERARFETANSIDQALASEADVLVLVMPKRALPKLEKATLESLRKRKIVGIGYGAAELFGQLGLEINGGACAHGTKSPPSLVIAKSELLREPKTKEPIIVFQEGIESAPDAAKVDLFAMFLPPSDPNAAVVDVIARWSSDPNYAPIVRQGNCVLIGIPTPATEWTAAYADLIRETCLAMRERKLVVYSAARREVTKPGSYEFKLAPRGSTEQPFQKSFFFQFTEAKQISVKLEHAGSDSVMMLFMGQDEDRMHWTRQDARNGETLKISASITREDIEKLGGRYWTLNVTNFGANMTVDCKLTITVEAP